jgi:RNA polymerase sigma-70 factor (ECF subfamily)
MTTHEYNLCVDQHADGVFRFIVKNIRDEEVARDVVQDVFAKMWEKVKEISADKAKSYLFTAAYHTLIDHVRKDKKPVDLDAVPQHAVAPDAGYSDVKEIVGEAVNRLPDIQRAVLVLRDFEGYSYKEIGDITGLNEPQVKVYIYRARMFLKNYIVSLDKVL